MSCTGYLVKQKRTVTSFLLQLLLQYTRCSFLLWYVFLCLYQWSFLKDNYLQLFILMQAETLRDSFPPSDKSLSRLLGEVPYLPNTVLKLLEGLCSPENSDKAEKELQSGDRVTQGLSTVWSLILLRPPFRDACLKIALKVFSLLNFIHPFVFIFRILEKALCLYMLIFLNF